MTKCNWKINSLVGKQADSQSFSFGVNPSRAEQPPPLAISCPVTPYMILRMRLRASFETNGCSGCRHVLASEQWADVSILGNLLWWVLVHWLTSISSLSFLAIQFSCLALNGGLFLFQNAENGGL